MLDENNNFENARRIAEWKKKTDILFSTVTDEIIAKLIDTAPDLGDKLWAVLNTFNNATTGEEYAQAMLSCRRLFQYVSDCLFPPTDEVVDGHKLDKEKYKNRLFEFAKRELKSETNIGLILTNTEALFQEWNKLYELSNGGLHGDPHRQECRRCILRTILLLDDLVALKGSAFPTNVKSDSFFQKLAESVINRQTEK
jgi:hypothetical protein